MNNIYFIAEAGVNHNGSIEMAKRMVDCAVQAGADAIKFQTFRAEELVTQTALKANYQAAVTDAQEPQGEMLKRLELSCLEHELLLDYCKNRKIDFLSTPFDLPSLDLLINKLSLQQIKISSGDLTNSPLLLAAARAGKKIILSTGMSTLGEIEEALGVIAFGYLKVGVAPSQLGFKQAYFSDEGRLALRESVTLLHCTTEYPAPLTEINLKTMNTLHEAFGLSVGYSDHSEGMAVAIAAAALGARVIEKHFTLDRNLPGPDHKASLEPEELKQMISAIRQVEMALGSSVKKPTESELKNKVLVRKSLYAYCDIKKGEIFSEENLTTKRPEDGASPLCYWDLLGKKAQKDYRRDDRVEV